MKINEGLRAPDIHAVNILTNEAVVIRDVRRYPFGEYVSGSEPKALVTGILGSTATESAVSYVERYWRTQTFAANWRGFHAAGQPVVQEVLRTKQGAVLTPDLKQDGGELFGKAFRLNVAEGRTIFRPRPAMNRLFLAMATDSFLNEIEEKALQYAEHATRHKLGLPQDDSYELHLMPDGSYSLVLLDLSEASLDYYSDRRNVICARALAQQLNLIRSAPQFQQMLE